MSHNYSKMLVQSYVQLTNPQDTFTQAGGAAGWINDAWDLSAIITVPASAMVIMVVPAAAQNAGVRGNGSAVDSHAGFAVPGILIVECSLDQHYDVYREAAQNQYICFGYFGR